MTLDEGVYFANYDYRFDVTRACSRYSQKHGKYRVPRVDSPSILQQGVHLRRYYRECGAYRPIVLCDDGIGTGESMRVILNSLKQLHIPPDRIIVLVNPNQVPSIRDADVQTVIARNDQFIWLSERDVYWGLPRSGLSLVHPNTLSPVYGIPYTIDVSMVRRRIELDEPEAKAFRECNLELNAQFWEYLESGNGRPLYLEDCPRLHFLASFVGRRGVRVAEFIRSINHSDYQFPTTGQAAFGEGVQT